MFLIDPMQPWIFEQSNELVSIEEIKRHKLSLDPKKLLSKPRIQILIPILEEAYTYSFEQKPNYNKLIFLLQKILLCQNLTPSS